MHLFRLPSVLILFAFVMLWFTPAADAASLTLEWDPPIDDTTVGYVLVYGTAAGVYSVEVDVGFATSRRVDGLAEGTRYFFSVKAYNSDGERSELSTEVSATTSGTRQTLRNGPDAPAAPPRPAEPTDTASTSPPSSVTAVLNDAGFIDIAWEGAAGSVSEYRVEVGGAPGTTAYTALTTRRAVAFDATDLPAAAYFIRVRSISTWALSAPSHEVRVTTTGRASVPLVRPPDDPRCGAPPRMPRQFRAMANGATVHLTWQPGLGDAPPAYRLQAGTIPGAWNLLTTVLGAGTELYATTVDGFYALRLAAVNECGDSVWAAETSVDVRGNGSLPGPPLSLAPLVEGDRIELSWNMPADGGPVTRHLIEATTPFGPVTYDTGVPSTSFANVNTPPGEYVVTVRAGNASGFGPPSVAVRFVIP